MMTKNTSIRIITVLTGIAVSLLSVSCRKTKITTEYPIDLGASFFYTRASVSTLEELQNASSTNGMGVYGYKTAKGSDGQITTYASDFKGAETLVFDNVNVTFNSSKWSYANTKYWDRGAYYRFVAYWPYTGDGVSESGHVLTIKDVPNWQPAETGNDWMTAASQGGANGYYLAQAAPKTGTVEFDFKHILAKITVRVYYVGTQKTRIVLNDLTLGSDTDGKKVPTSSGDADFTRDYSAATNSVEIESGKPDMGGKHYLVHIASGDATNPDAALPYTAYCSDETIMEFPGYPVDPTDPNHVDGGYFTVCSWLVVPFTNNAIPLEARYTVESAELGTTAPVEITTLQNIEAGKEYILTLKFDSNSAGLECKAIYVNRWVVDDNPASGEFYNW